MCKAKQQSIVVHCQQNKHSLVGEPVSSLIINFGQVIESFLVLNIYFTFFLSVVNYACYKSTIKSNCILLLCHVRVRSSRHELFWKKSILRHFAKFTGKRLCQSLFFEKETLTQVLSCEFWKFLRTSFLTEHLRWLLLAFQSEYTLYSFRTACSKQAQYLKFK